MNVLHKKNQWWSMRKESGYPGEVSHKLVRFLRLFWEVQDDLRSLLDEVRVLQGNFPVKVKTKIWLFLLYEFSRQKLGWQFTACCTFPRGYASAPEMMLHPPERHYAAAAASHRSNRTPREFAWDLIGERFDSLAWTNNPKVFAWNQHL